MLIVAIGNMKGGVGKTTLALMFAKYLSYRGYTVFVIDADPQGTLSFVLLSPNREVFYDNQGRLMVGMHLILKSLMEDSLTADVVEDNVVFVKEPLSEPLWLLPNCILSSAYDMQIQATNKHFSLFKRILAMSSLSPDVVIIDTPPYYNAFLVSALVASSSLIIPSETSLQAFPGVAEMLKLVGSLTYDGFLNIKTLLVVPTKYKRTKSAKYVLESMKLYYSKYINGELIIPFTELCNKIFSGELSIEALVREANKKIGRSYRVARKLIDSLATLENKAVLPLLPDGVLKKLVEIELMEE